MEGGCPALGWSFWFRSGFDSFAESNSTMRFANRFLPVQMRRLKDPVGFQLSFSSCQVPKERLQKLLEQRGNGQMSTVCRRWTR